jgi:hypothetical protein
MPFSKSHDVYKKEDYEALTTLCTGANYSYSLQLPPVQPGPDQDVGTRES